MHRFSLSLLGCIPVLLLASLPALAALQPVSEAALAAEIDSRCHFNLDTSSDCITTLRYTILTQAGREMISRIDFNFPEVDRLEIRNAESTQPGGEPIALASTQIDTRMAPNPDQGFLRDRQTSLAFPDLRVGSVIRYTVLQHTAAKPLSRDFHYVLMFAPNAVRLDRFNSRFTAEKPIIWRSDRMNDFSFTPSADSKSLDITLMQPRFEHYINEASHGFIRRIPRVELSSSSLLQQHFGGFARRYNAIVEARLPASGAKAVAAVGALPAPQRVAGLLQHLHDTYRYLGDWRASERGYMPFSLAEIEARGYGDCKDLAVLLAALLKASGIRAEPAWVSRGDMALALLIPGTSAPNHAIVRAEVDGQVWWLDPSNPVFSPGRTPADIQDRWALVIGPEGHVRQTHIPSEAPAVSLRVSKQEHLRPDGTARTTAHIEMSHTPLMHLRVSDAQTGVSGTNQALCESFSREVAECHISRAESGFVLPERYQVQATLTDLHPLQNFSGQQVYAPAFLSEHWNELANYRRTGQLADLYQGDPQITEYDITLAGVTIEPHVMDCTVRSAWFDMDLSGQHQKGQYRYQYRLAQKQSWLSHDDIMSAPFEAMLQEARRCNDQMQRVVQLNPLG